LQQVNGKNFGFSIAHVPKSASFLAGKGKIGTMERSESLSKNMLISCGVLALTAALIVSLTLLGFALLAVLGG
jgi:hypothetical protein